jgi:hypothetical protein
VCSGAVLIEFVFCDCLIVFSFKKYLKSLFLIGSLAPCEPFDVYIPLLVFLNVQLRVVILVQQVNQCFVIEFEIGDRDLDLMLVSGINFLVEG